MTSRSCLHAIRPVLLACLLLGVGPTVAAGPANDPAPSFERARALIATDPAAAAAMLDELARSGNVLAQMLLGAMLLEGKSVPQDRSLGLAFLQVADANADWMFDEATRKRVRALAQQYQFELPGSELIKADQLAASIMAAQDEKLLAEMQPALLRYTDQVPVKARPGIVFAKDPVQVAAPPAAAESPPVRLGCALEPGSGCGGAPEVGAAGHCTGRLQIADTPATSRGNGVRILQPDYPVALRRTGKGGAAHILTHVDSSGWICSAIVARSAGEARLDAAALESLRQWRFLPATKSGVAVESLKYLAITFRLN